jgi:hypothetical protein
MVSRKRSKGKERKTKQAEKLFELKAKELRSTEKLLELKVEELKQAEKLEKEAEEMRSKGRDCWQKLVHGFSCDHGFGCIIPDDNHPVSSFMDDFWANWFRKDIIMSVFDAGCDAFKRNQEMWRDPSYRQMAINIFVCIGKNVLLDKADVSSSVRQSSSVDIAQIILILENYDGNDFISTMYVRIPAMKARDLNDSGSSVERDLLKFYSKRIPCSCLKERYSEARRTLPKMGSCSSCRVAKQRTSLMVCSRCRVAQYCSKQCQGANWSVHQLQCDSFVCVHTHSKTKVGDSCLFTEIGHRILRHS